MSADAQAALVELATRFEGGRPSCGHASAVGALRWGPLYAELGGPHPEYVAAIELMYEGYLLHYRESRAFPAAGDDGETALLAGDSAYAEGLRAVARRGDVVSVRLLARLMSACAFLRDEGLAFAHDDSLWAYTVAAMAAQGLAEAVSQGSAPHMAPSRGADVGAARLFDEVDDAFREGRGDQVVDLVAAALARLGLRDDAALRAALASGGG